MKTTPELEINKLLGIMPGASINVTTGARKQFLLEHDTGFYMRNGRGYSLAWKSLGGGVWQASLLERER